ncbi:hypothetical protein ABZ816_40515 [Actinosynnema sp. NPDC047251]|uniref:Putative membrane protein n=1 Tax=Saccharothrix espanaensis (strain ATCC 51144 / DSM 44229 / JCM 9112 / NBRC 15066 / NRRL 15764) TaxID=1179773 RepID=K0JZX6_SACES|nr:hypothetical protein [Saccharothrix espanaensis]CCH29863.1 putative membrane protein [Saccharothrix espanaensis DSM 44229]
MEQANRYGGTRKDQFRRRSVALKVTVLGMSASATIILRRQDLTYGPAWRSRWSR